MYYIIQLINIKRLFKFTHFVVHINTNDIHIVFFITAAVIEKCTLIVVLLLFLFKEEKLHTESGLSLPNLRVCGPDRSLQLP